ncbi:MAG: DUF6438 domain-containing protein [Bacteroidia bacterium]
MKPHLAILIALSFLSACAGQSENRTPVPVVKHHNKLDDVATVQDIQNILVGIDSDLVEFRVDDSLNYRSQFNEGINKKDHDRALELGVQPWVKADFDGNGYTDLLVIGKYYDHAVLVILDSGENRFYENFITRSSFQGSTFPVVDSRNGKAVILNYLPDYYMEENKMKNKIKADTLVFEFGDFVEYHAAPAQHHIEKIEYSTGYCYGTCPVFSFKIDSDRRAKFTAEHYNEPDGEYSGNVDSVHYRELTGLLNYIDFPKLDSSYAVNWTDDQDCTLLVTYDGGKVKKIEDYGLLGTFGLERAYDMLFDLRKNQKWFDKKGKLRVQEKHNRQRF